MSKCSLAWLFTVCFLAVASIQIVDPWRWLIVRHQCANSRKSSKAGPSSSISSVPTKGKRHVCLRCRSSSKNKTIVEHGRSPTAAGKRSDWADCLMCTCFDEPYDNSINQLITYLIQQQLSGHQIDRTTEIVPVEGNHVAFVGWQNSGSAGSGLLLVAQHLYTHSIVVD